MSHYNVSILDLVEVYGEQYGLISSAQELSDKFDVEVAPIIIKRYGESDTTTMREEFNNWSDALTKDNQLHAEQYDKYEYVGRYAE